MNKIICLLLATTCFIPLLSASRNSRDNDRDEDFRKRGREYASEFDERLKMPRSRTSDAAGGNSQGHGGVLVSGDAVDGVSVAGSSSSSSSSAVDDDAPAASTGHAIDDIEKIDRDQVNSLIKL